VISSAKFAHERQLAPPKAPGKSLAKDLNVIMRCRVSLSNRQGADPVFYFGVMDDDTNLGQHQAKQVVKLGDTL